MVGTATCRHVPCPYEMEPHGALPLSRNVWISTSRRPPPTEATLSALALRYVLYSRIERCSRKPAAQLVLLALPVAQSLSKAAAKDFRGIVCVFRSLEKCTIQKKRFIVISNLRYMHELLNVDKIKN
jgi:hypothetical protein